MAHAASSSPASGWEGAYLPAPVLTCTQTSLRTSAAPAVSPLGTSCTTPVTIGGASSAATRGTTRRGLTGAGPEGARATRGVVSSAWDTLCTGAVALLARAPGPVEGEAAKPDLLLSIELELQRLWTAIVELGLL
jgi:hypothetical protein